MELVKGLADCRAVARPARVRSREGGSMIAPPLVSSEFTFSSVSDAV